jgi:D-alanyl-D-alanine carboxypeptidase/D-alanyl-D-alanine-endopeptidase (penicillin-binding protein 4)
MQRRLFVLLGWLIAATPAPAQQWPPVMSTKLAASHVPAEAVGLYVREVGATQPLLAWNDDRAMNPASTMKLITTLAALELLGPAYTWQTELYADGPLRDGVLDGDLVIKGGGDPKLTIENFWLLLKDLRARGVSDIRGDLIVDRSLFALEEADPGQFDNKPTRPYNVPPDALLLNFKSVRLLFVPDEESGKVTITSLPDLPQISVVNQLSLGQGSCQHLPQRPQEDPEKARLVFQGKFPKGCGEKTMNFSLLTPNEYLQAVFEQTWRELGGEFGGKVRDGPVPASARPLSTWQSPPVSEVIRDINKWSNNVMARQLYLTLGLGEGASPATTASADLAVRGWLQQAGLDIPELVLENGSGLSREERISARNLARVLERGWDSPLMPEYLASLPIPAVDGTLRRRLKGSDVAGKAHLKSGYLEGVRAVAGYLQDYRGRWLILVCIINHKNAIRAQPFLDAVVDWAWSQGDAGCCMR